MKAIIDIIIDFLKHDCYKILSNLITAVIQIFTFLINIQKSKKQKSEQKQENKRLKKIDDVCDKGDINDLVDIIQNGLKCIIICCSLGLVGGCNQTKIYTVYSFENRYDSVDDAKSALENATLNNNESIWILTNTTLKNTLHSVRK